MVRITNGGTKERWTNRQCKWDEKRDGGNNNLNERGN